MKNKISISKSSLDTGFDAFLQIYSFIVFVFLMSCKVHFFVIDPCSHVTIIIRNYSQNLFAVCLERIVFATTVPKDKTCPTALYLKGVSYFILRNAGGVVNFKQTYPRLSRGF